MVSELRAAFGNVQVTYVAEGEFVKGRAWE